MTLPQNPPTLVLRKGREQSILRRHPWVFSGAIALETSNPADGDWVRITGEDGTVLGWGHYQKGSITVRVLEFGETLRADLYHHRIKEAWRMRQLPGVIPSATDCFRLIHGEGDGLPGLIVDVYGSVAVIQAHSAGMTRDSERISEALLSSGPAEIKSVFFRSTSEEQGKWMVGQNIGTLTVHENNHKFEVDVEKGQKTGFFLDQRENRELLGRYSSGKKVLNTFCYSGGFSVYALKHGASLVHSVDASASAIQLCRRNLELNGFDASQHSCFEQDTFSFLRSSSEQYDVMVLDPPAFAKHKDARHQAMKGYQRLNAEAISRIAEDGILFTFSCSQVVDRQLFYDTVMSSAIASGRDVRVLAHLSQPPDHPVSAFHPEGAYLKGLVLHIR